MTKSGICTLIFFLSGLFLCFSQNGLSRVYGKIFDKSNNKPIENAHFIFEKNKGFISDYLGEFYLDFKTDSVLVKVSCLGYKSETIYLFKNKSNNIFLESSAIQMNEILLINQYSAKDIVVKMIKSIPKNYPNNPEKLIGVTNEEIYLDSLYRKRNYKATVDVLVDKFSYSQKNKFGNIKVLDQKIDWDRSISQDLRFYAGVHNVHRFDFVMNKKGVIDIRNIDNFKFKLIDTLLFEKKKVIVIGFENKKYSGSLFILEDSKALIRIEQEKKINDSEGLSFLRPYKRVFHKVTVDYALFPDEKWRLKFIQYKTQFKYKNKKDQIFLKNTFSSLEHKPMLDKIDIEDRFSYNIVLFDHIIKNKSIDFKELEPSNKIKLSLIANKIKTNARVGVLPYKSYPYTFLSYVHQDQLISNPSKDYFVEVINFSYSYPLNNFIRVFYSNSSSIKANLYNQNSFGILTDFELTKRGMWIYETDFLFGKRNILQWSHEEKFVDVFNLRGKKFDSHQLSYFGTQKEWFFSMGISFKYRISDRFTFNIGGNYFVPTSNTTGLTIIEENEFWPWNRKRIFLEGQVNSEVKKIFDSNFLFQLGVELKL